MFEEDSEAALQHGVSARSIGRWRSILRDDPEGPLAAAVRSKKETIEKDWVERLPGAITAAIDFLERAAKGAKINDPNMIHSVAGALKILTEVKTGQMLLDARLNRTVRQAREASKSMASRGATRTRAPR